MDAAAPAPTAPAGGSPARAASGGPSVVLLLPRTRERFLHPEQVDDLLRAPGAVAIEARRVPYGAFLRLPAPALRPLAAAVAARVRLPGPPRVVVIFHPAQVPVALALLERHPQAELWYSRWDRYECAYGASPGLLRRVAELHETAARRATLTFTVSEALARIEHEAGRQATVVTTSADAFPAPAAEQAVVAVSFGHLGHRVDWALLRRVAEGMPELVCLLVGELHPEELEGDEDFAACRALDNLVFLGWQGDAAAARLLECADVAILPFRQDPFNDACLPIRILKAARLGRHTVTPMLEGPLTWERAVIRADGVDGWIEALRGRRGARTRPDAGLREWALAQTAERVDGPLWERLAELGISPTSAADVAARR